MKAAQKQAVFSLLSAAARATWGYTPPSFEAAPVFADDPELAASPPDGPHSAESTPALATIAADIAACRACPLCKTRTQTVPGTGAMQPLVLVVGEAPGRDEDEQGLPFVGKAGQLLDAMLKSISLSRNANCFIANTVKCRPPENRDPAPEEEDACFPFLERQIEALKPKAILVVGRIAMARLLGRAEGITRIHGTFFEYRGVPVMPTFHPSFLLRDPSQKAGAWADLKKFRLRLRELSPGYEQAWSAAQ
jgi:DNA polymerase